MKRLIALAALASAAALAACSGVSVETDFDRDADFTALRTYGWVQHEQATDTGIMNDPLVRKHIRRAVEGSLGEKGYSPAAGEKPDFLVAFHMGTRKKIDVDHFYYRYGRWGRWGGHDVRVRRYREGTLVIDVVDASSKELVWRGIAKSALRGRGRTAEDIERSVSAVLKRFPPE